MIRVISQAFEVFRSLPYNGLLCICMSYVKYHGSIDFVSILVSQLYILHHFPDGLSFSLFFCMFQWSVFCFFCLLFVVSEVVDFSFCSCLFVLVQEVLVQPTFLCWCFHGWFIIGIPVPVIFLFMSELLFDPYLSFPFGFLFHSFTWFFFLLSFCSSHTV